MRYLPLFVDTCGLHAVVLGGGRAAYIKIKSLLKTEATVSVYAREICDKIVALQGERLRLYPGWDGGDMSPLDQADLLVIAFSGPAADTIRDKARERNLWTLCCDSPEAGNFHLGMAVYRDPVTVAAHTGGLGPLVGRKIADELQNTLDTLDMERLAALGRLRRQLIAQGMHGSALTETMQKIMDLPLASLLAMEENYEH